MAFTPRRLMRGASGAGGYQIARSLRFNSADDANLSKTHATATNRRTFTISLWIKRTKLGTGQQIANGNVEASGSGLLIEWLSGNELYIYDNNAAPGGFQIYSVAVYRDPSAWYHLVFAFDTTQATNTNRIKVYINGVQQDLSTWQLGGGASRYPAQNSDMRWNYNVNPTRIGGTTGYAPLDGYITDFYNIDGQQLTPSSFGETNAQTGVWQPKAYSGSYGTNGFYLNFSDNSNTTAATLGKDYSGNGNNFTPNNFSVTAGSGNDSLVDTPTPYGTDTGVGGSVRGNYCTMNPLAVDPASLPTITNGNLDISVSGALATIPMPTGTWYWEVTCTSTDADQAVGAYSTSETGKTSISGTSNPTYGFIYQANGNARQNGTVVQTWSTFTNNDILSFTYDASIYQLKAYKNNSLVGTITLTTPPSGDSYVPMACCLNGSFTFNFGQRPFTYTAPSGFKALCTQNLPTPTIGATTATQAGKYFNTVLYTGTGSSQSITGVGFQPDWVWVKVRSGAKDNTLADAVRGTSKALFSNLTSAELSGTWVSAFNSDGFTVGTEADANQSGQTFVGWNWKANGSGVTNTAGSITSTVSANPTSGFSVVTFTKTATTSETIGHGLGVAPSMIIVKARQNAGYNSWAVWHTSIGIGNYLELNTTAASQASSTIWNNTLPTSTVFSMGTAWTSTVNMVAYCFAPIAGFSAFGSYTGNGSTDGPFVHLGFRPAFLILKSSAGVVQTWILVDSTRFAYNVVSGELYPSTSGSESSGQTRLDFVSNGFKLRTTDTAFNQSTCTYIYMAFAENPFKYALAR